LEQRANIHPHVSQNQVLRPDDGATVAVTFFFAAPDAESTNVEPVCSSKRNLAASDSELTAWLSALALFRRSTRQSVRERGRAG